MAAAAEASLLRCEGVLEVGCLPFLIFERPRWGSEEAARTVVESWRAPFGCPNKAGHRNGRRRSSRLEEDCLYTSRYHVRFEARTNMLEGLTDTDELSRPDTTGSRGRNGAMRRKILRWEAFLRLACLISSTEIVRGKNFFFFQSGIPNSS